MDTYAETELVVRRTRVLLYGAIGALLLSLGVGVGGLFLGRALQDGPWSPLGEYSLQTVLNKDYQVDRNGTLDIVARKCAREDRVRIRGSLAWLPVNRPEQIVQIAVNVEGFRYRSCGPTPDKDRYEYKNPIPPAVLQKVDEGRHIWKLTGTDIPIDKNGNEGVPRTWSSETFDIT